MVAVATDQRLKLDVSDLAVRIRADRAHGRTPIAVVATAGTVNTGAIDPIAAIADLCAAEQIWLHVDGAYGLPAVLDPEVRHHFAGFERADSIAVDPHKWMAVPIGCGAVFVRDEGLLGRAFTMDPAEYLDRPSSAVRSEGQSPFRDVGTPYFHYGVEQTAPARGVMVWAALREIGANGFRDRVMRHNRFARHLADRVESAADLILVEPPVLSICCFQYRPAEMRDVRSDDERINALNETILQRLHEDGRVMPSGTIVRGAFAIRPCYINPRTTLADVDLLADEVLRHGALIARDFL